jgi:undecaprenyl-diphosphatase
MTRRDRGTGVAQEEVSHTVDRNHARASAVDRQAAMHQKTMSHTSTEGGSTDPTDVVWLIIGIVGVVGFALLTYAVWAHVVFPFDKPLLTLAHSWDGWPDLWKAVSETANIPLIVIGLGLVVWLYVTKRRREALLVFLMLAAVTAGSEGAKQLTLRPRPDTGTAAGIPGVVYSYPSGHVLEALTILGFVALRIWRYARSAALRFAVAIAVTVDVVAVGVARMALNAHYPTDVLAGVLGGFGALGLYAWLTRPGAWADKPPQEPRSDAS